LGWRDRRAFAQVLDAGRSRLFQVNQEIFSAFAIFFFEHWKGLAIKSKMEHARPGSMRGISRGLPPRTRVWICRGV